jgi:hypothetical protein
MSARKHFRRFTFGRFGLLAGAASLTALALFVSGPARAGEFDPSISLPALAATGDVNGDGFEGMLIGARNASPSGASYGGRDIILDFNPGESNSSHDKIDVSAIDAKEGKAGNQSFKYIGTKSFSDSKGELRIKKDGNDIRVLGDTDGDGSADLEILLDGEDRTSRFSEKDFNL